MSPRPAPPRMLTVAEAATQLSLSRDQVYRLISAGHLTSCRYPGRTGSGDGPRRIEQTEVDRFIAACRQDAGAA